MTLVLPLTRQQEAKLEAQAAESGLGLTDYALRRLLGDEIENAPSSIAAGGLASLFAEWQTDDATDDPEELARRDAELAGLKASMNASRAASGERPLFL